MSDIPRMGSLASPVRLDQYQRIIEVGWQSGWGVLTIDYPEGQNIFLDSHSDWQYPAPHGIPITTGAVIDQTTLDPAPATVYACGFDHVLTGELLYDVPTTGWSYQTVAGSNVPAGADNSAWIAETLLIFPGAHVKMCTGHDPGPDPPYGGGLVTMDEFILPDCSGVSRPAQDVYILYFGPTPLSDHLVRHATRKVYLIDFTRWKTGEVITIGNSDTTPDENLPAYNSTVTLTKYRKSAVLTGASNTITGVPAGAVTTVRTPYSSAVLARLAKGKLLVP